MPHTNVVRVTDQPEERGFIGQYQSPKEYTLVSKTLASARNRMAESCKTIANYLRLAGIPAQAQSFDGQPLSGEPEVVDHQKRAATQTAAPIEYKTKVDYTGVVRALPPRTRVQRGFCIEVAIVYKGRAYAKTLMDPTEIGVIDRLFDPDDEICRAFVASLPAVTLPPQPVATTPAPVQEVWTRDRINALPASEQNFKYLTDENFHNAFDAIERQEQAAMDAFDKKAKQEALDAAIKLETAKRERVSSR